MKLSKAKKLKKYYCKDSKNIEKLSKKKPTIIKTVKKKEIKKYF